MNPVCLDLGFIEIKWYSIFILIAFIVGYILVVNRSKKHEVPITFISDLGFYLVIFCIIGARLYYCLFNLDYYSKNLLDIFKIWEGGLAIHGGILAGFLTIYFFCKKKEFSLLKILDIFAPALVLGQAIGRWGNFFNSEAYGMATTLNALKDLKIPDFIIDGMYINNTYYHPTFFYESLGCLIIFIILLVVRNLKIIEKGQVTSIYLILYGVLRYFIEGLRTDSLMLFDLKVAQIVSILMIILGLLIFIRSIILRNKRLKRLT